jgi:hypothetical protein
MRRRWRQAKGHVLLDEVTPGCDVVIRKQGDNVRMNVRDIAASEGEPGTRSVVNILENGCQPLAKVDDFRSRRRGKIVEVREVLARDDLQMSRANGVDVEKHEKLPIFVYRVGWDCPSGYAAEQALTVSTGFTLVRPGHGFYTTPASLNSAMSASE